MNVLVTGGAGYIGSHTIVELLNSGHTVIAVDNLVNSSHESIARVEGITGKSVIFYEKDVRDQTALNDIFSQHQIDAVIHFAGLKAVGESVQKPLEYYANNIDSTFALLKSMNKHNVKKLVFSSSATVYGSAPVPYVESNPIGRDVTSPYGKTKYMIEEILQDVALSDQSLEFTALR